MLLFVLSVLDGRLFQSFDSLLMIGDCDGEFRKSSDFCADGDDLFFQAIRLDLDILDGVVQERHL